MPDGQKMEDIGGMPYKYLGVIESNRIKMAEMKEKVKKDYKMRVKKLLKCRLNAAKPSTLGLLLQSDILLEFWTGFSDYCWQLKIRHPTLDASK